MSTFTVTNPADPSQTYTFGTKGRKPAWVNDGLMNGTIKTPEGYVSAAEKAAAKTDGKPAEQTLGGQISALERRKVALNKKLDHQKNKISLAEKHVEEEKAAAEKLKAELAEIVKSLESVQSVVAPVATQPDAPAEVVAETPAQEVAAAV